MPRIHRPALVALVAAVATSLVGCVASPPDDLDMPCGALSVAPIIACSQPSPEPELELASVVVSQSQALPGFDDNRYLVDDPAELDRLEAILGPTHPLVVASGCAGGRTTVLEVEPVDAEPFVLTTDTCGDDPTAEEIDDLAQEWRTSGAFPLAP